MAAKEELSDVLCEFARTMVTDFPIQAILDHLVVRIVDVLPITAAGVTLISPRSSPHYVAASDEAALRFEELQSEVGEGPCRAAYETGLPVAVPDLRNEDRFPTFTPRALDAGLVAVFTFPLREGTTCIGALDLYRQTAGPLDAEAMSAAQTLADVAAAYLSNAQARADLRDSSDRYRESALHDALTGLPNRVLLGQRLDHAVRRAHRSGKPLALLFVDLDRFKEVNDVYGHQIGDQLLMGVAERLTALLRPGDTLARLSGDEFVVLCEDLGDASQVEPLAARMGNALTEAFVFSGREVNVTASVGVAFAGSGDDVPEQLLRDADVAMYQAKRSGGDRHQLVDLRAHRIAEKGVSLEQDLRGAFTRGTELRLEYQPIVTTLDGRITGIEALLRWDHPTKGLVPPTTVVALAERSALISGIGRWVLERACHDRGLWQKAHGCDDLQICVNVSAHQLMAAGFAETVAAVLLDSGTDPKQLTLEMTESVFVEDLERAIVVLEDLKHMGVTLALDDFGTGYSSLSYLQQFPIDIVKIDQTFISRLAHPPSSMIVLAVVEIAHVIGMSVVAEGVETTKQHVQVEGLGCDSCQGYYFARPMPPGDVDALLQRRQLGDRLPLAVPAGVKLNAPM